MEDGFEVIMVEKAGYILGRKIGPVESIRYHRKVPDTSLTLSKVLNESASYTLFYSFSLKINLLFTVKEKSLVFFQIWDTEILSLYCISVQISISSQHLFIIF